MSAPRHITDTRYIVQTRLRIGETRADFARVASEFYGRPETWLRHGDGRESVAVIFASVEDGKAFEGVRNGEGCK